jgi:cation:H+ antiporter
MPTRVRAPKLPGPHPPAAMSLLGLVVAATLPAVAMRVAGFEPQASPLPGLIGYGAAVVAAAFLLTWAAEVAQLEIGSGLAIVFLALVTVLPEYAVDMYLAWTAATVEENRSLALANMTGANRLLIGVGWPAIALLEWYRRGRRSVMLDRDRAGDVVWLGIATLYSVALPLKGSVAWYDAVVLIGCYVLYVRRARNEPDGSGVLVGPPRVMADWTRARRRRACLLLFLWSAGTIVAVAEPFVESMKTGGEALGIPKYFLIQWLAPLASESPEFVVVILLTLRGRASMALGALLSSKVNQWTLLVGGIPLAFGVASAVDTGSIVPALLTDARQDHELWLTATQSLYAVAVIIDLEFTLGQALAILGLFSIQLFGSIALESTGREDLLDPLHLGFCGLYTLLAIERLWAQRRCVVKRVREVFRRLPKGAHRSAP